MADREQMAIDLLCGELQTSWSYCDPSCISCKFYHEESDMGARVSICVHGFGSNKESCGCHMTQHEYLEFVRSGFANLKSDNAKLRKSLERAAGIIADICGECPVSRYEWLSSDGCANKCGTITEEECWIAYLTGKRWDESGAEVDG